LTEGEKRAVFCFVYTAEFFAFTDVMVKLFKGLYVIGVSVQIEGELYQYEIDFLQLFEQFQLMEAIRQSSPLPSGWYGLYRMGQRVPW
jgi:hypothetical protein